MLPTSLIVGAIVVGWLVVLVPMIVRRRQAIARTADSALAARVVRSGNAVDGAGEEGTVRDSGDNDGELAAEDLDEIDERDQGVDTAGPEHDRDPMGTEDLEEVPPSEWPDSPEDGPPRRYRPGRGGFDPEAAALAARAKYAFRQRVVLAMILLAITSGLAAGLVMLELWWAHGVIDLGLVCYLVYLRRQVRIEEEIRQRRLARMAQVRREHRAAVRRGEVDRAAESNANHARAAAPQTRPRARRPRAVIVEVDDEDPAFDELEQPGSLPYRRAVGE